MADEEAEDSEKRTNVSRRSFLKTAAAGAAAVGAAAAAPSAVRMVTDLPNMADVGRGGSEPLMAYVQNSGSGEIVVMLGTKEIVLRDFGLVSRLFAAMGA